MDAAGWMFVGVAVLSSAFWALSVLTSAGRDEDSSYGAEYGRGLAELSGVATILSVSLAGTLLVASAVGLSTIAGWSVALIVALASLWVVRAAGNRWPGLRLPTTWRVSD